MQKSGSPEFHAWLEGRPAHRTATIEPSREETHDIFEGLVPRGSYSTVVTCSKDKGSRMDGTQRGPAVPRGFTPSTDPEVPQVSGTSGTLMLMEPAGYLFRPSSVPSTGIPSRELSPVAP